MYQKVFSWRYLGPCKEEKKYDCTIIEKWTSKNYVKGNTIKYRRVVYTAVSNGDQLPSSFPCLSDTSCASVGGQWNTVGVCIPEEPKKEQKKINYCEKDGI